MTELPDASYAILLAGGSGSRLWPLSRERYPKQLVRFAGDASLLQNTVRRLAGIVPAANIRVVCGAAHTEETARHLAEIGIDAANQVIAEPCGRNTAPAILLAMETLARATPDARLFVFPADHAIEDADAFAADMAAAAALADQGHVVTFGIRPAYPETGYGYIEGDAAVGHGALTVKRFVEKPDAATAQRYVAAGNYFWNSGMFAFRAGVMRTEFETHAAALYDGMRAVTRGGGPLTREAYERLPNISIDYAVMEHCRRIVVLPASFGWSDIGTWKSLYDFLPRDAAGNVIDGDVVALETHDCLVFGRERLVAVNRLDHLAVIDTPDALFVSSLEDSRDVKTIVARLQETGRREYRQHVSEHFAWGRRTLLDPAPGRRVSRLLVRAGGATTLRPQGRVANHLVVVQGTARITSGGATVDLACGRSLVTAVGEEIQVTNPEGDDLHLLQVEIG